MGGRNDDLLSRYRQAILASEKRYTQGDKNAIRRYVPIVPVDRAGPLPLSKGQQRLWFLDKLGQAARVAYHVSAGMSLRGRLNCKALKEALDRILDRHEILRTTFTLIDGIPTQIIGPMRSGFHLRTHDLCSLSETEQELAAQEIIDEDRVQPFDLSIGPLIRGILIKFSEHRHILFICAHHIVIDAWSGGVLMTELSALYGAFNTGLPDPLPPLKIQYADFAVWQNERIQDDLLQKQLEFWTAHLSGAPVLLELPADRSRPETQSYKGSVVVFSFSKTLTSELRRLSKRHDVTLFTAILAGWSILLSRLSGQKDIVTGVPVANRQRAELEPLIGFFVNTLALRVQLHDDPTVSKLLTRVRSITYDAYSNQDIPFELVVEALNPPRSMAHSPIFQVMLAMENVPREPFTLPELEASSVLDDRGVPQFDISLSLSEKGEEIKGHLVFASDLFDKETVERICEQLETVLLAMANDDSRRVSEIPILPIKERQRILFDFNDTTKTIPNDLSIYELFQDQVRRHSKTIAVLDDEKQLSYFELNDRSNQLARYLIKQGIQPDDRVAVCMRQGVDLVVGLLAILKAGGAYVPVDPCYPSERIRHMIEDAQPKHMLTNTEFVPQLSDALPTFLFDDFACQVALSKYSRDNIEICESKFRPAPTNLAFVLFTSGSTGRPKGVGLEIRSVVHYLVWAAQYYKIREESVCPITTSMSFDGIIMSVLLPLLSGATVYFPSEPIDALVTGANSKKPFGFMNTTNSQLSVVLSKIPQENLPYLSEVIAVGGELLSELTLQAFRKYEIKPRLINDYGPTETTVSSTVFDVFSEAPRSDGYVHVGRPIWNTRIYILDARRQPVPIGVVGDVFIGGAGLARGYFNRNDLTAERFVEDPFSFEKNARMYLTGDVGRWLPDGNLEILGRNDFQVKIRGFRVELGEIESHLLKNQAIKQAVVFPRDDGLEHKRLVAYIVLQPHLKLGSSQDHVENMSCLDHAVMSVQEHGCSCDHSFASNSPSDLIASIRSSLLTALPEYMVPSAYVILDELPLTSNGKVNWKALPAPGRSSIITRNYEAPIGETERAIATIWKNLLGLERIGRHDTFFELGGHSLLAVRMISVIRNNLGVDLVLRDLFRQPTVRGLAQKVLDKEAV
ncbi:non-ribosomal peptide synthetase [Massilia sp. Root335]|uniref:non-ribosomal peptide synthetase n=1 Tax=Massilia sp. Root335 TaxID=1736517 RepID=UPI0009E9B75B|nr:non-ribosomal peptide synthetase [Massilia sp. Root335]